MARLDDVRAALTAELEAQDAQPDNPVIAAAIADLETELSQLEAAAEMPKSPKAPLSEAAAETPKPPPVDPPKAPPPEAPPAAPVVPPVPEAPKVAPAENIEPTAIQANPADHPSRLPPAARPHGLVPGNYRA